MDIGGLLKSALTSYDDARERSNQAEIGPSSVGGCARQAWNIIHQMPKTNFETESIAATMGTAIHAVIAEGLQNINHFEDFMIEFELSTPDIKGHIDFYSKSEKMLIDWKTVTLKKLGTKWVDKQKRMQIQIYGYLLEENGYPIENVALCAIPRDGWRFQDAVYHVEPYNREMALEGINWVRALKESDFPPAPEETQFFCKNFCDYFDETGEVGCTGKLTAKK